MESILLHLLPATIYAILAAVCARGIPGRLHTPQPLVWGLLFSALITHAASLGNALYGEGNLQFGLATAMSLTLWLAMLIYALESLLTPLNGLLVWAAPVAAVAAFVPGVFAGHPQVLAIGNWAFKAHIAVAMLAFSMFTLAAFHAILMAVAERRLHRAQLSSDPSRLPPLLKLEQILFRLIGAAFVLLSITVISGVFFSNEIFGKPLAFSHKAVFSITAWLVFGALLLGRRLRGWRGKIALRWTLTGVGFLVLAYMGSRFVLEVLLGRSI